MMRILYDIGLFVFALFYLPAFFLKGKHREGFLERFGILPVEVKRALAGKRVLWVHAVSVGEVVQAARLIEVLRGRIRDYRFVLTVTTSAGRGVARKLLKDEDTVLHFPVDFRACVRSFVRQVSPRAVVVLETEIWPNLIFELSERRIPVGIVNGRISDRAIGKYRAVRNFVKPVLNRLSAIAVQDAAMKQRFVDLGASPALVFVTGNMKFDWQPASEDPEPVRRIEEDLRKAARFLLVAGSTHEGEEEILFGAVKSLVSRFPHFRLLVAPRHLERIRSIEERAAQAGLTVKRVSEPAEREGLGEAWGPDTVLLLDHMGALANLYRLADAVFIGGSLVPGFGGHNLVEPAFFEKPVLFGPHMDDFREIVREFSRSGACVEVKNGQELEKELALLVQDEGKRKALGRAARQIVLRHQGATRKNVEALLASMAF
ncbi:MAG: 3-deoxy-D-manno-octulosonic acid transferase [Candidatus Omnitrophota bacterium]